MFQKSWESTVRALYRLRLCSLRHLACHRAQGSVEYAVVLAAFLSIVIAIGALWHLFGDGVVLAHALQSASHHVQGVLSGAWADIFLY